MADKTHPVNETVLDVTSAATDLWFCIAALNKSGPHRQQLSIHSLGLSFKSSQDNLQQAYNRIRVYNRILPK